MSVVVMGELCKNGFTGWDAIFTYM